MLKDKESQVKEVLYETGKIIVELGPQIMRQLYLAVTRKSNKSQQNKLLSMLYCFIFRA